MKVSGTFKIANVKPREGGSAYVDFVDENGGKIQVAVTNPAGINTGDFVAAEMDVIVGQGKFGMYFRTDRVEVKERYQLTRLKATGAG